MRISGGDAKGIKLTVPKGIRPASEKVRQAIFSSLAHRVLDARVLDLYCGSGAYGLEALSRGADAAVFVDSHTVAVDANITAAGFGADAKVRRTTVERYLARQASTDGPFDLVFADPPYADPVDPGPLAAALAPDGLVIWESRWRPGGLEVGDGWLVAADRRYGDTRVSTLTRGTPSGGAGS